MSHGGGGGIVFVFSILYFLTETVRVVDQGRWMRQCPSFPTWSVREIG